MRKPEYISPSALKVFEANPEEYYLRYLADTKPPKFPQTLPMSAGSAFDAYAKSYLATSIYGRSDPKFSLDALFEAQVESHNRDAAKVVGAYLFEMYKSSGALADMMLELKGAVDAPHFEFEVRGTVEGQREGIGAKRMGVPLLGKPDIKFINSEGETVIFDWKVNGYYSKSNTSPVKGFLECREQQGQHWCRRGCHKDAMPMTHRGLTINAGAYFEDCEDEWAAQLATYSWLLGSQVGVENIIGVDQFACNGAKRDSEGRPNIRIASHRSRVSRGFQFNVINRYLTLWGRIIDEPFHFFHDLTVEASREKCAMLDGRAALLMDPTLTDVERWTAQFGREQV